MFYILMSLSIRQKNYSKIKKLFKIKDNYCSTYMDTKFLKKLDDYDIEKLGEGARGKIYKLIDIKNNISLSTKIMLVDDRNTKYIMDLKSPRWREVKLLLDFTNDVKGNKIRNLPLMYGYQVCKIRNFNAIIIYYEYFEDILKNWLNEKHTDDEWISLVLQILITIKFLREKYKVTHNDLTWVNIMYNKIDKTGDWKYITNDYELYIPNMGYEFIFWDFGSSKSYNFPLRNKEIHSLNDTFKGKRDQKYILDITKRIKMNHIINRYSIKELISIMKENNYEEYLNSTTKEIENKFKRYSDKSRLNYVISKSLAFFLVENDKYDELIKNRAKKIYDLEDDLTLPSKFIQDKLEKIVNVDFESNIDKILKEHFKEYLNKGTKFSESYNLSTSN